VCHCLLSSCLLFLFCSWTAVLVVVELWICIQSELNQAEAETLAARERARKQLQEARKLTNLKTSDTELPQHLQHVCCTYITAATGKLNVNSWMPVFICGCHHVCHILLSCFITSRFVHSAAKPVMISLRGTKMGFSPHRFNTLQISRLSGQECGNTAPKLSKFRFLPVSLCLRGDLLALF